MWFTSFSGRQWQRRRWLTIQATPRRLSKVFSCSAWATTGPEPNVHRRRRWCRRQRRRRRLSIAASPPAARCPPTTRRCASATTRPANVAGWNAGWRLSHSKATSTSSPPPTRSWGTDLRGWKSWATSSVRPSAASRPTAASVPTPSRWSRV